MLLGVGELRGGWLKILKFGKFQDTLHSEWQNPKFVTILKAARLKKELIHKGKQNPYGSQ